MERSMRALFIPTPLTSDWPRGDILEWFAGRRTPRPGCADDGKAEAGGCQSGFRAATRPRRDSRRLILLQVCGGHIQGGVQT
jgi:hypothetical protein